jgi:hypothetical protein
VPCLPDGHFDHSCQAVISTTFTVWTFWSCYRLIDLSKFTFLDPVLSVYGIGTAMTTLVFRHIEPLLLFQYLNKPTVFRSWKLWHFHIRVTATKRQNFIEICDINWAHSLLSDHLYRAMTLRCSPIMPVFGRFNRVRTSELLFMCTSAKKTQSAATMKKNQLPNKILLIRFSLHRFKEIFQYVKDSIP